MVDSTELGLKLFLILLVKIALPSPLTLGGFRTFYFSKLFFFVTFLYRRNLRLSFAVFCKMRASLVMLLISLNLVSQTDSKSEV